VHLDGTDLKRLTGLGGYAGSPQWSRDGRRTVYHQSTPMESQERATSQTVSIGVETGATQAHTSGSGLKVSPRYVSGEEIGYVLAR